MKCYSVPYIHFRSRDCLLKQTFLIHNLKWPTISDIIRSETATTMYKSLNDLAPEYLSTRFVKNSSRNIRQLRNTETDLFLPLRNTSNGLRAISFRGSQLWNQLDYDLQQAPSLATFKQRLKGNKCLYSVYFILSFFQLFATAP